MRLAARTIVQIVLLMAFGAPLSAADERSGEPDNWDLMFRRDQPRDFARYPEDVAAMIDQGGGWYTQIASTTVWQGASSSKTDPDELLNTSYSFAAAWEPIPDAELSAWIRGGRPVGEPQSTDLSGLTGSILGVNASLENDDLYLRELYWSQELTQTFRYSIGWVDSSYRYDFNAAANDDAASFLSTALVNSPTIPFPDSSVAADLVWNFGARVGIHLGLYQTNCNNDGFSCITELEDDEWIAPVELIFRINPAGWGTGNYRFLLFTTEDEGKSGAGFSMSFDQEIGRFMPFIRVSAADKDITDVKRFYSVGTIYKAPLQRPWDKLGIGFVRGSPSDPVKRTESLLELYWLFQLTPIVAVTPDVQIIFDPANNPAEDRITVVGVRLQLDF